MITALVTVTTTTLLITSRLSNHPTSQTDDPENALALENQLPNPYQKLPTGIDVSYPQCRSGLPTPPISFAIIGVTGGKAFKHNPCLATEYSWATKAQVPISFYINTNFPYGTHEENEMSGPQGRCQDKDLKCQAYNYGWNTAADAKAYADSLHLSSKIWWIDIETNNHWEYDSKLNIEVIKGALNFFTKSQLTIGIYTAPRMWAAIVGEDYNPQTPIWIAGAHNELEAKNYCEINVGSGPTWLSQYGDGGSYDRNLVCSSK